MNIYFNEMFSISDERNLYFIVYGIYVDWLEQQRQTCT